MLSFEHKYNQFNLGIGMNDDMMKSPVLGLDLIQGENSLVELNIDSFFNQWIIIRWTFLIEEGIVFIYII